MPRILVLHCPAGGGHKAAAFAIAEAAAAKSVEARVVDALAWTPPWFAQAYVATHLTSTEHTPWLYGAGFDALNRSGRALHGFRAALDRSVGHDLVAYVRSAAPDVVVATHFFPLTVLCAAWRHRELDIPVVGVVTDHFAHAFWAEPCVDRFCVGSIGPAEDLVAHGVPRELVTVTGIPVRAAFGRIGPPEAGAGVDRPLRVLVTSGGFGVGPVARVVRSLGAATLPTGARMEVTVVCGDNSQRVASVRAVAESSGLEAEVVGFELDMAGRLAWADLVVGKPGGLTVSECLAAGRPMLLVGACPGQEMENQRWLIENGAAVASDPEHVGTAVTQLVHERQLAPMAERAHGLGRPEAAREVVGVALSTVAASRARAA